MDAKDIRRIFLNYNLFMGQMISSSKSQYRSEHPMNLVVFNAGLFTITKGFIWGGDIDITKSGNKLLSISKELGETIYVLRESNLPQNFDTTDWSTLTTKSIWNTNEN